ncbi:putative F-box domain-containing protein [Tanacetum coccineum]|uniref:F-box domain-containing protein n=1 Tax=Tanacetum coccineum TaxID=301880 RepID=A0ABQ5HUF3_9ASTR
MNLTNNGLPKENHRPRELEHLSSEVKFRIQKLRSVSKAWKSLISFKFIAKLDNVYQLRRQFIYYSPDDSHYFYHTFDDETFPQFYFTSNPTIGQKSTSALRELIQQRECPFSLMKSTLVGSSHGLLCFYYFVINKFFIWNPSIGKFIAIVVPSRPTTGHYTVVGFGVCPFTLDPKIIMIPHCFKKYSSTYRIGRVEVFSLSSCAWAPSINLPRETVRLEQNSQEVIDGFIYWLASDSFKIECDIVSKLIISFGLTSEEFSEIHLPESIKLKFLSISKLRETLVVLEYNMVTFSEIKFHAVWMMDNDSFTRLYTIMEPATSLDRILGFRKTKHGKSLIVLSLLAEHNEQSVLA